jgi:hypothetical protein
MMSEDRIWMVSTKKAGVSYEVLSYDPVTKEAKLKGRYSTITQTLNPESLKHVGYILTKENPYAKQR